MARLLAEKGYSVAVYDRRSHLGGNCYDICEFNSYTHVYGPHLFHTSSTKVLEFLQNFTDFYPYSHRVTALIDGANVPIPFSLASLEITHPGYIVKRLEKKLVNEFGYRKSASIYSLLESADADIKQLGEYVFDNVFKGYTCKQWGVEDPLSIDKAVLNRIPVRISKDTRYFTDTYQYLPSKGYTYMIANILDHQNIQLHLESNINIQLDANNKIADSNFDDYHYQDAVVYTGPIDELFSYKYEPLQYRSLIFKETVVDSPMDYLVSLQTNFPNSYEFTRICDYSYLAKAHGRQYSHRKIISEFPCEFSLTSKHERFYPHFTLSARNHYSKYKALSKGLDQNIFVCGRLGDYKYYDMDDAIIAAIGRTSEVQNYLESTFS